MNLSLNQNANFSNQRIVDCAFSWIGTPFKKHGRVKNVGVDCIGLIIGILEEIEHPVISNLQDKQDYNFDSKEESLIKILSQNFLIEKHDSSPCIAVLEYSGGYQHLGLIVELQAKEKIVVHADISARKVVAQRMDSIMKERIKAKFKF